MAEFDARIKHKRDTEANWTAANPVLLNGEIIFVDTDSGLRRKVGDGSSTYSQLSFDSESTVVYCTLLSSEWSDGKQTLSVDGLTAESNGIIGIAQEATEEQLTACAGARPYISGQSDGYLTITMSGDTPDCDIPVIVIIWG